MDSVVYTALFGRRGRVYNPVEWDPAIRYVCFTDNPSLGLNPKWETIVEEPLFPGNPRLSAKWHKVMAHQALACDQSLWLDASVQLRSLKNGWGKMTCGIALHKHPSRNCIYHEARRLVRRRIDVTAVKAAVERYRLFGHPARWGLWKGGIIWRKHTEEVAEFERIWWDLILNGSFRDQISLPVALRVSGARFETFPRTMPNLAWRGHRGRNEQVPNTVCGPTEA